MKGIVLAGGAGTRLYPATGAMSKQLLPIYDKPMIYYPIATLMQCNIRDILIICTKEDLPNFKRLLGNGKSFGIKLKYAVQEKPNGIAEAFIIGKDFIKNDNVCLILGDNIFHGYEFRSIDYVLNMFNHNAATVFGYQVNDPERYGVVEFNEDGNCLSIEEKPEHPKSNYAVVGLYFYPNDVVQVASMMKPSKRGELEITDVNKHYLENKRLKVNLLPRGCAWLDTGTPESYMEASNYIEAIEKRQGLKVACLEEIAWRQGWLTTEDLIEKGERMKNQYGNYLKKIVNEEKKN